MSSGYQYGAGWLRGDSDLLAYAYIIYLYYILSFLIARGVVLGNSDLWHN
jgi:hypothetical protein